MNRSLVDQVAIAPEKVTLGANIANDLAADYLDKLELVMFLKNVFYIKNHDSVAKSLLTVQQTIN